MLHGLSNQRGSKAWRRRGSDRRDVTSRAVQTICRGPGLPSQAVLRAPSRESRRPGVVARHDANAVGSCHSPCLAGLVQASGILSSACVESFALIRSDACAVDRSMGYVSDGDDDDDAEWSPEQR
jgi:hypothetical protein